MVVASEGMIGVRLSPGEDRTPNLIASYVPGLALRL